MWAWSYIWSSMWTTWLYGKVSICQHLGIHVAALGVRGDEREKHHEYTSVCMCGCMSQISCHSLQDSPWCGCCLHGKLGLPEIHLWHKPVSWLKGQVLTANLNLYLTFSLADLSPARVLHFLKKKLFPSKLMTAEGWHGWFCYMCINPALPLQILGLQPPDCFKLAL